MTGRFSVLQGAAWQLPKPGNRSTCIAAAMEYHTIYKGPEGETTEWEDLQARDPCLLCFPALLVICHRLQNHTFAGADYMAMPTQCMRHISPYPTCFGIAVAVVRPVQGRPKARPMPLPPPLNHVSQPCRKPLCSVLKIARGVIKAPCCNRQSPEPFTFISHTAHIDADPCLPLFASARITVNHILINV